MEFHVLHQSYRPSTYHAFRWRSRKILYKPTPWESSMATSHSSRCQASVCFHQFPEVAQGPATQMTGHEISSKEMCAGFPAWQRTRAEIAGRKMLMVSDSFRSFSDGTLFFSCVEKLVIRNWSG